MKSELLEDWFPRRRTRRQPLLEILIQLCVGPDISISFFFQHDVSHAWGPTSVIAGAHTAAAAAFGVEISLYIQTPYKV